MVEPIRFERGGPAPRFKVQKLRDLEDVKDQIDYEIKEKISMLDTLSEDQSQKQQKEEIIEENRNQLADLEDKISVIMQTFNDMISGCELCESLNEQDCQLVKEKLLDLQEYSASLKKITENKIALSKAKLLTKCLWSRIRYVNNPVDQTNRGEIESYFKKGGFSKDSCDFQKAMSALNNSLESTKGLTGNALYVAMIKKGELLEAKEELITVFLEYKRKLMERYQELQGTSTILREMCPSIQKKLIASITKAKEKPNDLTQKIIDSVLSDRYSNPTSLIKDAIGLSILKTPPIHQVKIHNLSISQATLSLGFSLPVSLLSTLQLIRNRARYRKIKIGLEEAKNIQSIGELMYKEGLNVQQISSSMLAQKIEDPAEIERVGLLIKQAQRLTSLGIELKEKALLASQELSEELKSVKFSLFNGLVSTPLGLAGIASTSMNIASKFIQNPALNAGMRVMHFVGIASGTIGLVLGSMGIINKAHTIHKTREKLNKLGHKAKALMLLEKEYGKDPLVREFCGMEKSHLLEEKASLQKELRNYWIELGNSILLTIGGAIAFAAMFASTAATGGLAIAVIVIISLSTAIVIAYWAKKKTDAIEKKQVEPLKLANIQGDLAPIANYMGLNDEKKRGFLEAPEPLLQLHFKKE